MYVAALLCKLQVEVEKVTNTNMKKQYQQTIGLIQGLFDNVHLLLIGVIVQRSVVSESLFVCYSQVCLAWKTISYQIEKGNRVKIGANLSHMLLADKRIPPKKLTECLKSVYLINILVKH